MPSNVAKNFVRSALKAQFELAWQVAHALHSDVCVFTIGEEPTESIQVLDVRVGVRRGREPYYTFLSAAAQETIRTVQTYEEYCPPGYKKNAKEVWVSPKACDRGDVAVPITQ